MRKEVMNGVVGYVQLHIRLEFCQCIEQGAINTSKFSITPLGFLLSFFHRNTCLIKLVVQMEVAN
jgi:hypothetical protein